MSDPARRWRLLAAGLVLALAQGRAWGQESIWARAADVVRRVQELPFILPPLPDEDKSEDVIEFSSEARTVIRLTRARLQSSPPPPIFAWEKKDDAECHLALVNCLEMLRDYEHAYFCYRALSLLYPARQAIAVAAAHAKAKYLMAQNLDGNAWWWCITRLDDQFSWLIPAEPRAPHAISSALLPCCDGEHSDGPITDELLDAAEPDAAAGYSQFCAREPFGPGLFRGLVPKDRSFPMFPRPAAAGAGAPVLPGRKDMLPDSEHGRLLIDLGVITDPHDLLALPDHVTPVYFDGLGRLGRIMF
jgi:hypothetical protein